MGGDIFLSGANITAGGPLEIYKEMIDCVCENYPNRRVFAIVGDKRLFSFSYSNLTFIEITNYKRFILLKFYYEYLYYFFLSKKYNIDLWLSINDCTPSVRAKIRAVYCHNATPFYKRTLNDFIHPTSSFLQSFYYPIFYRINLHRNNFVIVQQEWIKSIFVNNYNVDSTAVIVNHFFFDNKIKLDDHRTSKYTFIYPTKAQPYKKIEVICEAIKELEKLELSDFKVIFTINGSENTYSRRIYRKYGQLKSILWMGTVNRNKIEELYASSNCLIFSSNLETWGLPLTEFKAYKRPILVVDLPYARETIGDYEFVKFFKEDSSNELKLFMLTLINNKELEFDRNTDSYVKGPLTKGLKELFVLLISKN